MMTRKDYVLIAKVLNDEQRAADFASTRQSYRIRNLIFTLADKFSQNYSNFDRKKFYAACFKDTDHDSWIGATSE